MTPAAMAWRVATYSEFLMDLESPKVEYLSLAGDVTRRVALQALLMPGDGSPELVIPASLVERVDAVAGTGLGLRLVRHLREHPSGHVTIMPPSHGPVARQFLEFLSPLPSGVAIAGSVDVSEPPRFALVPATPIPDDEAAVIAGAYALEACDAARISEPRANLVGAAVLELAANALQHATGTHDPPVVAVTVAGRERVLEVAVTDLGTGISEAKDPAALLRLVPGANGGSGFLPDLIRRGAARELDVSIEMNAGTGRLRWKWNQHRTENLSYVPGTSLMVRISA